MIGQAPATPRVIRVFPGYAESVLWYSGPVPCEAACLSARLTQALREWERWHKSALSPDFTWVAEEPARRWAQAGEALAQRVAEELGNGFIVEYRPVAAGEAVMRLRGGPRPANPRAAASMTVCAVLRDARRDSGRETDGRETDGRSGWTAYAPLAGRRADFYER